MIRALICLCLLTSCETTPEASGDIDQDLEALRRRHAVSGLNVGVIRGGELVHVGAYGFADAEAEVATRSDTIFLLASVSKVFVGLAIARALERGHSIDLDADVNTYLGWAEPLQHPDFPDIPITLRMLMRHESGIASDGPGDYDTYPKPDPTSDLDTFLEALLADAEYWEDFAPGTAEEYSNLGTALAALVVEKVVGQPFADFCNEALFGPLGMADTRWFFGEYSPSQQARVARTHDEEGNPYEHYGFDDWPSGQLRSTVADLSRALIMLIDEGGDLLAAQHVEAFETTPFFIAPEGTRFGHSGGEAGINTYMEYDHNGDGLIYLINHDLPEDDDAFIEAVEARLRAE